MRPALMLGLTLALLAGCSSGHLEVVHLNFREIDPPAALPARISLDECRWWTEEDGALRIALRRTWNIPFAPTPFVLSLALDLEKLPAGKARNYEIAREMFRGAMKGGPIESRMYSTRGVLALYREPGNRLRGSLRVAVSRVTAQLLGGWSRPAPQVVQGTFTAVFDPKRGREIRAAAELPRATTTQPDAAE